MLSSRIRLFYAYAFRFASACACVGTHAAAEQAQSAPFKVLAFFSASYESAHIDFAHETNRYFPKVAAQYGFTYDSTKDWEKLNDPGLAAQYQVVMFLDDQPKPGQRAGFQKYMENGGGFIGFHVSAFASNAADWDWYHNKFLGAGAFKSNTWGPAAAIMRVEDSSHAVTKGFPRTFTSETSEWYNWTNDLRKNPDIKVLCSIDPSSYPLGTDPNQAWYSGDNPIVWTNTKFKMIYCNSGHNDMDFNPEPDIPLSQTWSNQRHCTLILNALQWIAGRAPVSAGGTGMAAGNLGLELRWTSGGLNVTRPGLAAYTLTVLDPRGVLVSTGATNTGELTLQVDRMHRGMYLIQSQSTRGSAVATLRIP